MSTFGAEIDGAMVVARAVHFAATAVIAGVLMFRAVVADPVMRGEGKAGLIVCNQIRRVAWIALAVAVVSGAVWLLLEGSAMSGQTFFGAIGVGCAAHCAGRNPVRTGRKGTPGIGDRPGDLPWLRSSSIATMARACCRAVPRCRHCLDGACCFDALQTWISAPDRRSAAPRRRGGLDRRPGGAFIAESRQPRSQFCIDTARHDQAFFGAWHGQRRHALRLGHGQCVDFGRIVPRSRQDGLRLGPDGKARHFRCHGRLRCGQPVLADAAAFAARGWSGWSQFAAQHHGRDCACFCAVRRCWRAWHAASGRPLAQ
jgi:hypothetical protein